MLYPRKHPEGVPEEFGCCHDHDSAMLESLRAEVRQQLLRKEINGFEVLRLERNIAAMQTKLDRKLAGTRLILLDKAMKRKTGKYAFVIMRSKKPPLIQQAGRWVETDRVHLAVLEDKGIIIEEVRGRWQGGRKYVPPPDYVQKTDNIEVSFERAHELEAQGEMILWRPNGRECALWVVYA